MGCTAIESAPTTMGCTPKVEETLENSESEPKLEIQIRNIGVEVSPTSPPPPKVESSLSPTLLKCLEKYKKTNWRIDQLARSKHKGKKFVPVVVKPLTAADLKKKVVKIPEEIAFYNFHQAQPPIRVLVGTKLEHKEHMGLRWTKKMDKRIKRAWESIYNFYKKKIRDQKRFQLKRLDTKIKLKKVTSKEFLKQKQAIYVALATPKKTFPPPPLPAKKICKIDQLDRLPILATPKERFEFPPKSDKLSKAVLEYHPTDNILKLAEQPKRFLGILPPLVPGVVKRSALRYKITDHTLKLTEPLVRHCQGKVITTVTEQEVHDCFKVQPNALKYKATPRIKKLAEPKERK